MRCVCTRTVMEEPWISRRSVVYGMNGCVATSQPLASEAGLQVLRAGGSAADAAVAAAAALNVTQPTSTGIGGDAFCLYWDATAKRVYGINGTGRAPAGLTLELARSVSEDGGVTMPVYHAHTVTVPGAAQCWVDTVAKWGRLPLSEVLQPAIRMAEQGVPIAPVTAHSWASGAAKLRAQRHGGDLLMPNGESPRAGDVMRMPHLAQTFRELATRGRDGFYKGRIAQAIVDVLAAQGGTMTLEDLAQHTSTMDDPIHVTYRGHDVWEMPPNGQGITALMALNMLQHHDVAGAGCNTEAGLHLAIEAMRLAFADARHYVADPSVVHVPTQQLLSPDYGRARSALIDVNGPAQADVTFGTPMSSSGTVYLAVVDGDGNAASFINSNYMGFGTGIVPPGCGFTLQNRGANFSLSPCSANAVAPRKRPYHTIIPSMITKGSHLTHVYGVMGGFMQPQGHVQVVCNLLDHGMDVQRALDTPRFCIADGTAGGAVFFEPGIEDGVLHALERRGHVVAPNQPTTGNARLLFGNGQVIARNSETHVLSAGSDGRIDGVAIAY